MENIGENPSLLGYGCMRLPVKDNKIDTERAEALIDKAFSEGVTYFDTAYPYHKGESEEFLGNALKKYDRNKFYLATKLPVWEVNSVNDAEKIFNKQLQNLKTDYVDFYLLHALSKDRWEKVKEQNLIPYFEELQKEGKIKHLGFSFHDSYEVFEEILNYRKWDFCQIQLNYMDKEVQAGLKGYELAEKLGVPLVIMEPIKGGSLTTFSKDITDIFKASGSEGSLASWALRWVASLPNVKVVLSGMSTEDQLEDNLNTFNNFKPLKEEEENVINEVIEKVKSRINNGCTNCKYCMPCPFGVDIPKNFNIWNEYAMYQNAKECKMRYSYDLNEKERADKCHKCGVCETKCPQKIHIREDLEKIALEMKNI